MASLSRCCMSSVLLVALLFASLLDTTSAIIYNYTGFFDPVVGCSLTVGLDGSIYVGLCSAQTILKLSSSFVATPGGFNTAVQQTLAPYNNNSQNILLLDQLGITSANQLWFIDEYNQRVLGVDSTLGTVTGTVNLASVGGAWALGVSVYSANIWVSTPGAGSDYTTIVQYSPSGSLLQTIKAGTDPNYPTTYFPFGLEPDPTNTLLYVGGCNVVVPGSIVYEGGQGIEYSTAPGNFYPCDIRAINIATQTVQLPILTVSSATRGYLGTNTSFFQTISIRPTSSPVGQGFPAGSVWASDSDNGLLFAFSNTTGAQLANFSGLAASPAFTPTNNVVALGNGGLNVVQYNGQGSPNTVYAISNVTFGNPGFVAVGNGGSPIYVSSLSGGPVAIMSTSATITGYIGTNVLVGPNAIAVDGSGNVFVIDGATNIGYKFTSSGTQQFSFSYPGSGIGAGLCIDPNNGNIVVPADNNTAAALGQYGAGYVLIFNSAGTLINILGQSITYPWACAVLSNSMIIVDSANEPGSIVFLNPTTGNTTFFQDPALGLSFETVGMAVGSDGRIFIAALNFGIYIFSSSGQYVDVISSPQETIYTYSMAYTSSGGGLLYVADNFNQRIVTFKVGTSGPGGSSSDSSRTASSLATTAVFTVAALVVMLFIGA